MKLLFCFFLLRLIKYMDSKLLHTIIVLFYIKKILMVLNEWVVPFFLDSKNKNKILKLRHLPNDLPFIANVL